MTIMYTLKNCGARGEMVYIDFDGNERLIEPYSFRNGRSTVYAYCRMRDAVRIFPLSKIGGARPSGQYYEPRFRVEL